MTGSNVWHSELQLPEFPRNLATMLIGNCARLADRPMFQQMENRRYQPLTWQDFLADVAAIQHALAHRGIKRGHRVVVLSPNRKEMLEIELAVMSMGAAVVPVFAGYAAEQAQALVEFCEASCAVVADTIQYQKLSSPESFDLIVNFDPLECETGDNVVALGDLIAEAPHSASVAGEEIHRDSVCLMMFTSGTMGKPKCVQLTHGNILSQQAAMRPLWHLDDSDRFLSYLPWHHSFGGIYEKYAALYNGALLSLEHGFGKNIELMLENWRLVKPTVFFSVPQVYRALITLAMQDSKIEKELFHDQLRFVFTAAAPLPANISDMFKQRNIPVHEGWGLTETSPCCTVTDPRVPRSPGVVGKPIPGVSVKIADDGEIIVRGPNVMKGYYHNPEATQAVLSDDGWFSTGDIGEFTEAGLRLISRKDRIFKLSNAEKVVPTEIENLIVQDCCFLSHAFVHGSGEDHPVVLLFPNKAMLTGTPDESQLKPGCDCPSGMKDFAKCLTHCMKKLNTQIDPKYARPSAAMLIDYDLSIENKELTPSMKLAPNVVGRVFRARLERLHGKGETEESEEVYVLDLEEE